MARNTPKSAEPDASVRLLVLHGSEEAIQKDKIDQLKAALSAEHGEVDVQTFDGKAASLADVFDELRGYSLMGGYKLVVVDPADDFVKAHRQALERYAKTPVDHASLVLRADTWHKGNLDKDIAKVGAVIKCEPPSSAEAVARLMNRAQRVLKVKLERPAAQRLVDRLGVHLVRLETELDKLAAMAGGGAAGAITPQLVEAAVGKSSDEKAWEVQEALLTAMAAAPGHAPGHAPGSAPGSAPGGASTATRPVKPGGDGDANTSGGGGGVVIEKVHELMGPGGHADVLVMYCVADLMRKLAVGGQMKAAGMSNAELGKALKLWGPRQDLFMRVLLRLGSQGAAELLERALEADARAKRGFGETTRNLEGFCARLTDVR